MVVLRFKFHQNRISGFGAVGVEICPSPLTWPLAYTTACTTIQAASRDFKKQKYVSWVFFSSITADETANSLKSQLNGSAALCVKR